VGFLKLVFFFQTLRSDASSCVKGSAIIRYFGILPTTLAFLGWGYCSTVISQRSLKSWSKA
jgi:hypothetical protein